MSFPEKLDQATEDQVVTIVELLQGTVLMAAVSLSNCPDLKDTTLAERVALVKDVLWVTLDKNLGPMISTYDTAMAAKLASAKAPKKTAKKPAKKSSKKPIKKTVKKAKKA